MNTINRKQQKGFAMPIIIIVSASALLLILALSQAIQSMRTYTTDLYYTRLAEEAAEAGTSYALACLEENNRVQTWGNTPATYLTQNSDCNGNQSAFPGSSVIALSRELQSRFEVGSLDTSNPNSVQISAKGFVDVKLGGGTTVAKTYEHTLKRAITWTATLEGTRSVSGTYRTCAIMSGSAYCWGYNAYGQLGNGQYLGYGNIESPSSIDSSTPVRVKREAGKLAGKVIVDMFTAQYHSCALTSVGKVYCWGHNANGQLGDGTFRSNGVPVEVGGALADKKVTAIGGTANTSCAVAEGKIYCWGFNANGLVGIGLTNTTSYNTPRQVVAGNTSTTLPASYTATAISTSGSRSGTLCAIADGKAYCWGRNGIGEVGDGSRIARNVPTKVVDTGVLSGKTVTAISQDGYVSTASNGFAHVCAVADNKAYCWGENNVGQLGTGNLTSSAVPVAVNTSGVLRDKVVTDIAVGLRHTCALASGEVYCWGLGRTGQLGNNDNPSYRTLPVKVYQEAGALLNANIVRIGAGANRGCAVVDNGKSFCWGLNDGGQIGDGTFINRHKPTESIFLRPKNNEYIF